MPIRAVPDHIIVKSLTLDSDPDSEAGSSVTLTPSVIAGFTSAVTGYSFEADEDTDITAELTGLISEIASSRGTGGRISLPKGRFNISSTVAVDQIFGLVIQGHGEMGTELNWTGGLTTPMFKFNRCQSVTLCDLTITAPSGHPLLEGVRIEQGTQNDVASHWAGLDSSRVTCRNILIRGQSYMGTGFRVFLYDHNNDDKNDHHWFENVQVTGCRHAAFVLEGTNAKAVGIRRAVVIGTVGGSQILSYGVLTVANKCPLTMVSDGTLGTLGDPAVNGGTEVYNKGASFSWVGGQCAGTTVANAYVGSRNDPLLLEDIYSEKSARLLVVPSYGVGASGAMPISVRCCKFAMDLAAVDNEIIQVYSDMLTLTDNEFGARTAAQQVKIRFEPAITGGGFLCQGNTITNAGDGVVFVSQAPSNSEYTVTNRGYNGTNLANLGPAT